MSDLNVNWKDGVGEVTDQPLTVSPGSGAGNASVSFGSVMNNGLDRTLELEITAPKGTKKILTVNQEGCRQAYVTSDGKRWLTSDNRVYGVLKGDAPCQCFDTGMRGVARFRIDDKKQISVIDSCGDSSWIKGRRCLVKKTDAGVAICYLDENNSELFHDGKTQAKLDGTMGQWMTDIPSYRYSYTGFKHDNNYDIINYITLTHNDVDDNITKWGNKEDMDKEASFVNLVKDRDDDGRFAILWNFSSDDDITIKNTCHESFHVAMSVCQFCNMSLGFKVGEDEHAAYIAGFAGGCAYDFLYSNSTE